MSEKIFKFYRYFFAVKKMEDTVTMNGFFKTYDQVTLHLLTFFLFIMTVLKLSVVLFIRNVIVATRATAGVFRILMELLAK